MKSTSLFARAEYWLGRKINADEAQTLAYWFRLYSHIPRNGSCAEYIAANPEKSDLLIISLFN